jgi:kinesin family protein 11
MITPCCGDLKELKGGHYHRIVEITENAGKCLLNEYMVRIDFHAQSVIKVYLLFTGL